MRIAIFTNGDANIGFGHISRTLVIAEELRKLKVDVVFIVPITCLYKAEIIHRGYELNELGSFQETANNIVQLEKKYNIILVDSVEKDYSNLCWVSKLDCLIVSITLFDFNELKRYEELSFYPHIGDDLKIKKGNLLLYSGRKYLCFDNKFANYRSKTVKKNAKDILITMGGTDPCGLTLSIVNVIKELNQYKFTILLSDKCPTYDVVKEKISELKNATILNFVTDMPKRLFKSDIVILNGGLTRYEACIVGTPFLAISLHEKQFKITQELVDLVGGINMGIYSKVRDWELCKEIVELMDNSTLRKETSLKMQNLIDLNGATRICSLIIEAYNKRYEEVD
ncbi:MAG: hypothetical protein ACN6PN_02435 [Sphingobacterium sp.]